MRDLAKDKAALEKAKRYVNFETAWVWRSLEHYIIQYEAAQARVSELEAILKGR